MAAALAVPMASRRQAPTVVFLVIAAVALVQWAFAISLGPADLAILVALYTVAAHGERRDALVATAIVLVGIAMAATRFHFGETPGSFLGPPAIALAAVLLGDDLRNRRAYLAELEARTDRLEADREAEMRQAVTTERSAIARELHDVVAHNLSVMVIQAEAATYAIADDPDQAQHAMQAVTGAGRQALDEMRRLLDVLRPDGPGADRRPQPGLGEIPDLVDGVRQAGLDVELSVQGEPRAVAPGVQLALYRIVQEALTNTLKHAGRGAASEVELRFEPAQRLGPGDRRRPPPSGHRPLGRAGPGSGRHPRARRHVRRQPGHRSEPTRGLLGRGHVPHPDRSVNPIRVGLVDDQDLVRAGLRVIVEAQEDMEVVGEAADGLEAVELARSRDLDVLLVDVRMPRLDGIEACRRILEASDGALRVLDPDHVRPR